MPFCNSMNKTLLNLSIVLLFALPALTSCEKCGNVMLSEPSVADSEWLVYKKNDTITFKTETGSEFRYARTGIYAQNIPGEGFSAEDECIDQIDIQVRTVMEDVNNEQPFLSTRILSKPNDLVVGVSVGEKVNDKSVEIGVWEIDENSPDHDSLAVNQKMYYNVFELNPNDSKANGVRQILFNKGFGFLRVEFENGKLLERVPSS